ncbi:phosphoenolpyruvate carboxykinase [Atrimonas thermophila]|uniref:phosphoenolpyruvate carboxykinase n=1 Tax=Atrimonas thermophila TaxID=3064161 RepID=UPI00399CD8AC
MTKDHEQFKLVGRKVILKVQDRICDTPEDLLSSRLFRVILKKGVERLVEQKSPLLKIFGKEEPGEADLDRLLQVLHFLVKMPLDLVPNLVEGSESFLKHRQLFNDFIEYLYNFWRDFERYLICTSPEGTPALDRRPYRTFNNTVETLTHLVRSVYRDLQENITGEHPWIYRQVRAGTNVAAIAVPKDVLLPEGVYREKLSSIPIIRQILLYPPLILDPPMNKRTGQFRKIVSNPLEVVDVKPEEWLCYPAKVGPLLVLIYFHEKFYELGFSLCNLFEIATDEDLKRKPDAVYLFGVPGDSLDQLADFPTVFYDDQENNLLIAACPNRDMFGYFGYLKKMVLTLHNVKVMKMGRLPFHGAMVRIFLKSGKRATILMIGDTAAGKSETLEAFRILAQDNLSDMIIIADDMGSLEIDAEGKIRGYGTEIGAFLRLDDLQPGYAFGQVDRAIIMSPSRVNARVVIPVTTFSNVIKGWEVDFVLYANNYEEVDEEHPIIERFSNTQEALRVFAEGAVMSKGTTTATGIVHSYFANIFGPPQYRELHDELAQKYFEAFFKRGIFVGQMRTRLGIPGWERKGPEEVAKELIRILS